MLLHTMRDTTTGIDGGGIPLMEIMFALEMDSGKIILLIRLTCLELLEE